MEAKERASFVSGYTKVLTTSWQDAAYRKELIENPKEAIKRFGLDTPANARVKIITDVVSDPNLEAQVAIWDSGKQTGSYELFVPPTPEAADFELNDEILAQVDGGIACCSCCCCPCCSCT